MTTDNNTPANTTNDTTDYSPLELPRPDLREPAFRRYEPLIAKAIKSHQTVFTYADFPVGAKKVVKTARTFISRFSDAKLAYKRYRYQSSSIPTSFDLSNLVCTELQDGSVLVRNHAYSTTPRSMLLSSDHVTLKSLAERLANSTLSGPISIQVNPDTLSTDLVFLQSLEDQYMGTFAVVPPKDGVIQLL
jgi:hypothetical protein